jgi:hypothetical protein
MWFADHVSVRSANVTVMFVRVLLNVKHSEFAVWAVLRINPPTTSKFVGTNASLPESHEQLASVFHHSFLPEAELFENRQSWLRTRFGCCCCRFGKRGFTSVANHAASIATVGYDPPSQRLVLLVVRISTDFSRIDVKERRASVCARWRHEEPVSFVHLPNAAIWNEFKWDFPRRCLNRSV